MDPSEHLLSIPSSEAALEKVSVRRLGKHSDCGSCILSGISFDVPRGTIVGIIGPSGSGKSTLLKALNRLWEPPKGTVYLDGKDVTELDVIEVRRRVGILFQVPALFEGSVADNVRYGPKLQGKCLEDAEVTTLLEQAGLDASFVEKPVHELSVGQQQRVALARTLANMPEVLLLDEPTSALDPVSAQKIESLILRLSRDKGLTIILVSHSIKQVQRVADLALLLVEGQLVETIEPSELENASHPLAKQFIEATER